MRAASLVLVVLLTACSDDHSHSATPGDPCSDGGAYERLAGFTDEACRAYVDAESRSEVVTDASKAPVWLSPPSGTTKVPQNPPPRFVWSKGTLASTTWKKVWRALRPIGEAWAHGDTTGDAFVLVFKDGAGKEVHRVMTLNLEYTPGAAAWDHIRAAGSFTVTLVGVRFTRNAIASGTKPTAAAPLTLTVE